MKAKLKEFLRYPGLEGTAHIRSAIDSVRRPGWPYCPADEGDILHTLARNAPNAEALEVGFATGSSAAYILGGLGTGTLTSIDYAPDHYDRAGIALLKALGYASRHILMEENSVLALPSLHRCKNRYGLVFLDGWKTFDHLWVDVFYCANMLAVGGHVVLDDARMPAVRKSASILEKYYNFELLDTYRTVGGVKLRAFHGLTGRTLRKPYLALRKRSEIWETEAGKCYFFWKRF